jgi:hypothetical protein
MKVALAVSAAAVIAGLIVAFTMQSLLGPLLIIGGMGGLGWMMFPAIVDRIAQVLSTGTWRRPYK